MEIEISLGVTNSDSASIAKNRFIAHKHFFLESEAWVDWKFNKSPFGNSIVALARNEKSEVIACNAYGVVEYSIGNKIFKLCKPYETFVHDDYQGKGLFNKMLTKIKEEANFRGIDGLLFFPNENSLNSLKKNNDWTSLNTKIKYLINTKASLSNLFKLIDIKKSFIPSRSSELSSRSFNFRNYNLENNLSLKLNARQDYLNWRFNSPTLNLYRKFSSENTEIVIREGLRGRLKEAQIIFIGSTEKSGSKLLKKNLFNAVKLLHQEFDFVGAPMSENNDFFHIFKELRFFSLPSRTNVFIQPISHDFKEHMTQLSLSGLDFHTY